MNKKKGFTLIELLVVIAIIALLMGILMPALTMVKEQARRQTCLARIKQQGLSLVLYANENNGRLPLPGNAFYWLQDLDVSTVNFLLDNGMTREMFYCPSNHTHQKYNELFWEYANQSWDSRTQRFTDERNYICSGYCFILDTRRGRSEEQAIVRYERDPLEPKWIRTTSESQAASRELIVDSIMAQRQVSNTPYGYDFQNIQGGIFGQAQVYDTSSHLKGQYEPAGGNVWYLDQHGEWRGFEPDMDGTRAVGRYGGGNSPSFFW
ncbi:MAG: type II secretion system protein [Sedimentisphaerales bacterium]|nr:type II secretion system protein [Sedimentisphaerales bacterium]